MNLEARRVCYRASHLIVRIAEKSDYVENFNVSEVGKMTPMGLGEGGMETLSHIDSWCWGEEAFQRFFCLAELGAEITHRRQNEDRSHGGFLAFWGSCCSNCQVFGHEPHEPKYLFAAMCSSLENFRCVHEYCTMTSTTILNSHVHTVSCASWCNDLLGLWDKRGSRDIKN